MVLFDGFLKQCLISLDLRLQLGYLFALLQNLCVLLLSLFSRLVSFEFVLIDERLGPLATCGGRLRDTRGQVDVVFA